MAQAASQSQGLVWLLFFNFKDLKVLEIVKSLYTRLPLIGFYQYSHSQDSNKLIKITIIGINR